MVRIKWLLILIGSVALPTLLVWLRNITLAENLWAQPMTYVVLVGIVAIVIANMRALRGGTD